jgi:hypothetical protein
MTKPGKTNALCPEARGGAKRKLASSAVPTATPKKSKFRKEISFHLDERKSK